MVGEPITAFTRVLSFIFYSLLTLLLIGTRTAFPDSILWIGFNFYEFLSPVICFF